MLFRRHGSIFRSTSTHLLTNMYWNLYLPSNGLTRFSKFQSFNLLSIFNNIFSFFNIKVRLVTTKPRTTRHLHWTAKRHYAFKTSQCCQLSMRDSTVFHHWITVFESPLRYLTSKYYSLCLLTALNMQSLRLRIMVIHRTIAKHCTWILISV